MTGHFSDPDYQRMDFIGKLVIFAALGACLLGSVLGMPVTIRATAEPAPAECVSDNSVPNRSTLTCPPGTGAGQHAFIRCRDIGGVEHVRIGATLGTEGGVSEADCASGESGPI
ncbi:hypothetical protein ACFXHA_40410 [Nocardia sp. NPDC059240]|uniref:hypothetical protein n=1 Tax=Nocardia sp. NPDC059240 TaxID=3346786 RepID=UPI00368D1E50